MTKSFEEVIVIGGTGVQTSAYPTISAVGEMFINEGTPVHFIDGAHYNADGELVVLTPREQAKKVIEIAPDAGKDRRLYLTHCLGMAAAVQVMANHASDSHLLALAPPLPSPYATINTSHSKKNITTVGGKQYVPGFSWSDEPFKPTVGAQRIDVLLPEHRNTELQEDIQAFTDTVASLENSGQLSLVLASKDWNTASSRLGNDYSRVLHLNLTHSLMDRTSPNGPARAIFEFATRQTLEQ